MAINDIDNQFDMARLPIKPYRYDSSTQDNLPQLGELMIDKSRNLWYYDPLDRVKHNITQELAKEGIPLVITSNTVTIPDRDIKDGASNTSYETLNKFITTVNSKYLYASGLSMVNYDPNMIITQLRNNAGQYYAPITKAECVIMADGSTIQDAIDDVGHVGFTSQTYYVDGYDMPWVEITFPFKNFIDEGGYFELRIGGLIVDSRRYSISLKYDVNGDVIGATLSKAYSNDNLFSYDRAINVLYIYNVSSKGSTSFQHLSGTSIISGTIPASKLARITDSYLVNDSSTVASAKSVYNLYESIRDSLSEELTNCSFSVDYSTTNNNIRILFNTLPKGITTKNNRLEIPDGFMFNILCTNGKQFSNYDLEISYVDPLDKILKTATINVISSYGNNATPNISKGSIIKMVYISQNNTTAGSAYLVSASVLKRQTSMHRCIDQETNIQVTGFNIEYGGLLNVYRNGIRLFEGIDYTFDEVGGTITLLVRTEEDELIIFESITAL